MPIFSVTKIKYDTDGEAVTLPEMLTITADTEEEIADVISDETGFCVMSFSYDEIDGPIT
jgi:hypothetical protein